MNRWIVRCAALGADGTWCITTAEEHLMAAFGREYRTEDRAQEVANQLALITAPPAGWSPRVRYWVVRNV